MRHTDDRWQLATLRATRDLTPTVRELEFAPDSGERYASTPYFAPELAGAGRAR